MCKIFVYRVWYCTVYMPVPLRELCRDCGGRFDGVENVEDSVLCTVYSVQCKVQ